MRKISNDQLLPSASERVIPNERLGEAKGATEESSLQLQPVDVPIP